MKLDIVKLIDLFNGKMQRIFIINSQDETSIRIFHRTTKQSINLKLYQRIKLLSFVKI